MKLAGPLAAATLVAASSIAFAAAHPYLDGPGAAARSPRARVIAPHGSTAGPDDARGALDDGRSAVGSEPAGKRGAHRRPRNRYIVPHPDADTTPADVAAVAPRGMGAQPAPLRPDRAEPDGAGVGGSGGSADGPTQRLEQRVSQLQQQVEQLQAQRAAPAPQGESEAEQLAQQARAIEGSRQERTYLLASVSALLGEAQLLLITGEAQVGDYLAAAEALLNRSGAQAAALGPGDEVVRTRGALAAIAAARYWIDNSDLWHARGSLDAAIFETQAARKVANGYALPLAAPGAP